MLRLRKILLLNSIYIILFIWSLIISILRINYPSIYYNNGLNTIKGKIISIENRIDNKKIIIKSKEKLIGYYYGKTNIHLGDNIEVYGEIYVPDNNHNENTFNYKNYLKSQNIYHIISIKNIKVINKNNNILIKLKESIISKLSKNKYLNTFILGNKSGIDQNIKYSYQVNGLSHLFAISGMHITLLSSIILFLLKKVREEKRYLITMLFLILYLLLISISPSVFRGVLFFIIFSLNKIYYFYIKDINLYLLVFSISILINPFCLLSISFWYSYSISLSLILMSDYLTTNNYFISLLKTSLVSFITSIPITLKNFYELNFLSIIYNLFFVPLITYLVFPLSLLRVLIKELDIFYLPITNLMEFISSKLVSIKILDFIFPKVPNIFYAIYIILVIIVLINIKKNNYKILIIIIIPLLIHCNYKSIMKNTYIKFIDVGQGDSILIHKNNENILIDTGGLDNMSLSYLTTLPLLKSLGVKRINTLILSHGDYDHMGEAINLVNNIKVDKVIFNCGTHNSLEKDLIKVLKKKNIKYYSCINELNTNINLYFLQTKPYDNENDYSNVIITEINNYKFLFTGDASINTEKEILNKYNLPKIDILKVGHHGSKTSTSKALIKTINPKYSIISVGKNNKYNHPNKEVLNNLKKSKIYRTDKQGGITVLLNNKFKIKTCIN